MRAHEGHGPDSERPAAPLARPATGAGARARPRAAPGVLLRLQATAGNAAVARLVEARRGDGGQPGVGPAGVGEVAATPELLVRDSVVQRKAGGGDCPAPPVAPEAPDPAADPKFKAVVSDAKGKAKDLKKHPPASAEAKKAKDAAQPPAGDRDAQAKEKQADKMSAAKPKGFDKAAFIAAVKKAIADAAPKNLDEADKFADSGKADGVKSQVMSKVSQGKDDSGRDVAEKAKEPPDPSVAKDKAVVPLKEERLTKPAAPKGADAMPSKAPGEQVDMRAGPGGVEARMKDAEVTEEHLEESNEPEMQDAAKAKRESEAHAAAAPAQIRDVEGQALQSARAGAGADATAAVQGMFDSKGRAVGRSGQEKGEAKSKDEAERARITGEINKIFDATKADVEKILTDLDGKVATAFEQGEAEAKRAFTTKHKADMERYKDERYSGATGWARWTADLFTGLPAEANQIYERARALYESKMEKVISDVADLVGAELTKAKDRIELGRKQIKDYVAKQPKELQKFADEAAKEIGGKFDELESDVDAKQESLVSDLAQKYVEARNKVDEEIKAEQEKNKGLVDKAMDAVGGAIEAILKLKDLFMSMLAKAASVFTKILADPVAFIGNFMSAVKQGFMNFATNILDHLKKGLMGWLFGALASAGIELPDSFDLKGILKLVLSILGLTWANIRARIVRLIPAPVMDFLESKVEVFVILVKEGPVGLSKWILEKVGDLTEMVLGPIKEFVVEKIVKAGITWVLGMLNPAGALIKIIQALISVVQWIVERGAQLVEFVNTVIDGVVDIARGGVGSVPAKIEGALAKAVPLVISFLASLLGLGGISEKIRSVIETVQKPVSKAIDAIVKGALKAAGPLIAKAKGLAAKAKAKVLGGDDSPEGKKKRLDKAMVAAVASVNRFRGRAAAAAVLRPVLSAIRVRYGLTRLEPFVRGNKWNIVGELNPKEEEDTSATPPTETMENVRGELAVNLRARSPSDEVQVLARVDIPGYPGRASIETRSGVTAATRRPEEYPTEISGNPRDVALYNRLLAEITRIEVTLEDREGEFARMKVRHAATRASREGLSAEDIARQGNQLSREERTASKDLKELRKQRDEHAAELRRIVAPRHVLVPPPLDPGTGGLQQELVPQDANKQRGFLEERRVERGRSPHPFERMHDAEVKTLEEIAGHVRRMIHRAPDAEIKGAVYLAVNETVCPSCIEAMHRFTGMFKGRVKVVVVAESAATSAS